MRVGQRVSNVILQHAITFKVQGFFICHIIVIQGITRSEMQSNQVRTDSRMFSSQVRTEHSRELYVLVILMKDDTTEHYKYGTQFLHRMIHICLVLLCLT